MNVQQLREALQELEAQGLGKVDVTFTYGYGDYWNTAVAAEVKEVVSANVKYSEYHQMDKVVDYDTEDEGQVPAGARSVVMLG